MSGGGEAEGTTLEFTPTWVVAAVCTVIVSLSLAAERILHYTGKVLSLPPNISLFPFLSLPAFLFCISVAKNRENEVDGVS